MENRLEHLNQVNDVPVHSVLDPEFASYGRVVTGYDFSEMIAYMEQNTPIPENGNIYVASVSEMEALAVSAEVQKKFYGDMPIEVGYCNGRNTTWNGFEYHKGSEINVAVTDFMLILGHVWQIEDNTYRFENAKVFFVPKGTPVMRPLFLQYEDDPRGYTEQFEYLYGPDLLVAPVWQSGKTEWEVYLPSDEWTHLWTGEHYAKGTHTVPAELGDTPVFCRKGSQWAELFDSIRAKYGK